MTYHDAVEYLYGLGNSGGTPRTASLDRMRLILAALGDPQQNFKCVHIAGTKGKGSSAAMLESCLRAHNFRTGLFTSPHLHTMRERIRVGGEPIPREHVVIIVNRLRPILDQHPGGTTFEALTALSFVYFAECNVTWAVIETGVGGRLDSTNVIQPRLSLITSISLDHTAWLGTTLKQIATEKAGIIKPGIPVVSHQQALEAQSVIEHTARERAAPLTLLGRHWRWSTMSTLKSRDSTLRDPFADIPSIATTKTIQAAQSFEVKQVAFRRSDSTPNPNDLEGIYNLSLLGAHQLENATGVIAALDVLRHDPTSGLNVVAAAVKNGLHNTRWPGRFELLRNDPPLIADGAHNVDSINKMAAALAELFAGRRWTVIFGCFADKDASGMLKSLAPRTTRWIFTQSRNDRARPIVDLIQLAADLRLRNVSSAESVTSALALIRNTRESTCVCGSLSLVAEAREAWLPQDSLDTD